MTTNLSILSTLTGAVTPPYQNQDAFPYPVTGWKYTVASHLSKRPVAYLPRPELLDLAIEFNISDVDHEIVSTLPSYCRGMADHLFDSMIEIHMWFDDVLPTISWFRLLADYALEGKNPDSGNGHPVFGPNPDFEAQREEFLRLQENFFSSFVLAQRDLSAYSSNWMNARASAFAMMKNFRLYTRCVESLVSEVWPDLDKDLLLSPDFGDHCK
jgi:hypothetical protein